MTFQGHPRSLILAPIERAYITSYSTSIVAYGHILTPFRNITAFFYPESHFFVFFRTPSIFQSVPVGVVP